MMAGGGFAVRREVAREAFENIGSLKSRGILALIGIVVGTAAVIAMLHISHNARLAAMRQFEALGPDQILMQPQASGNQLPSVSLADVLALPAQNVGIASVAALVQAGGSVKTGRGNVQVQMLAATDDVYAIGRLHLCEGRFTSHFDGFSPFAVVGAGVAADIAASKGHLASIGEKIEIDSQILTVVGVLRDSPQNVLLGIDFNRAVIVPFAGARRIATTPDISTVIALLAPGVNDTQAAEATTSYFAARMRVGTMSVVTARQLLESIDAQMRIYALLILGIGTVSLVVSGVSVMNVMLMSVMERQREIGLRLALGARREDICLMFLCESMAVAAAGSAIGSAFGYFAGWLFASNSNWEFEAAPFALLLGAGMALIVGLFFGIYPAIRASRLDPVVALRIE